MPHKHPYELNKITTGRLILEHTKFNTLLEPITQPHVNFSNPTNTSGKSTLARINKHIALVTSIQCSAG